MTDILTRLRTVWPADYELQPKTSAERKNVIEIQRLKADAADEIERLLVNEKASASVMRKWAAERSAFVDRIEILLQIESAAINMCDVKGRHHSELAMNRLMEVCGKK